MPILQKKIINVSRDGTQKITPVTLIMSEIEDGEPLPKMQRSTKYDFQLERLHEDQSIFFAKPDGMDLDTFKAAARNHVAVEREEREFRQNFLIREAEKTINGQSYIGLRIFCKSIADYPMRSRNKKQA